jgi:putative copper export protein/methionine-rich copper-binding protein CopC
LASAYVVGSDPVDGSTIASVPQEVHIYFNAAISALSRAHVLVAQQGTQNSSLVEVGANTGVISDANANELIVPLHPSAPQGLPQGSYLVRWAAVANDDGRTTFGTIGFNVGISSTGLSGTPILGPSTSNQLDEIRTLDVGHVTHILAVMWEWVMVAALTLWIGTLVMEQFVLSDGGRCTELHVHTKKRAKSLQWLCLCALLFSAIVTLVLRTTDLVGNTHANSFYLSTLQSLLINTNYGHFWLTEFALILIAMGSGIRFSLSPRSILAYCKRVLRTRTLRPIVSQSEKGGADGTAKITRPIVTRNPTETSVSPAVINVNLHPVVWLSLSGLILLMLVLSRAPAQTFQPHVSALLFDWLNLAALSIWFGSFVYLGYLILPLFNNKELEYHTETLATILRRLIPFVLPAISIELVSTLFLSEAAINQPQQLISDPYGRTLLVQIVLLVVMLILSLYALLRLHATLKHQVLLLPLVHADLPVRRLRQSELHQTKKSLGVLSVAITWLGVGILLSVALMTFFTPPIHFPAVTSSNQSAESYPTTNAQTKQIGDLSVSLFLSPGRSDQTNTVVLLINDRNGKPVTDAQVRLTMNMQVMDMGTKNVLIPGASPGTTGNGLGTTSSSPAYVATFDKGDTFSMAGLWVIAVEIQRPNQDAVKGTFEVMLS